MSNLVQITKDQNNREMVMVRVDKTLKELMQEKPSSRLDPEHWHVKYDNTLKLLNSTETTTLEAIKESLTLGHVGPSYWTHSGIKCIGVRDVLMTGINNSTCRFVEKNGKIDTQERRVQDGDIIFIRSGVGSLGRVVVATNIKEPFSISGHLYKYRCKDLDPYYIAVYLMTKFGKDVIFRTASGVSGQIEINFPEFLSLRVPLISPKIQEKINQKYKKLVVFHDKAIEVKKKGDEVEYRNNLETAEKLLRDLISKTESVIRGEREDVI